MSDTPIRTEQITDDNGTYTQEWYCQPPPEGNAYHVTRSTWSPDMTVRKIYEIQLGEHW